MSSSKKYAMNSDSSWPKMVVCGTTEQDMPKLIMCEDKDQKRTPCTGPCSKNENEPQAPRYHHPQPKMMPRQYMPPPPNPALAINGKLQADIAYKERTIEELHKRLCAVQCEMNMLLQQNTMLNSRIQQAHRQDQAKQCPPNSMCQIENRLNEYSENTRMLEKQLNTMENSVKAMKDEFAAVQANRINLEKYKKPFCFPPSLSLPQPGSTGRTSIGGNNARSSKKGGCCTQLSLRKAASDQHLLELKDQYCQLQQNFKMEAENIVKKIHKNLDSIVK